MKRTTYMRSLLIVTIFLISCNRSIVKQPHYENQIGDTPFNAYLDTDDFKFCDPTNVLHKRSLVTYKGGTRAFEQQLIKNYNYKLSYEPYSGYFIIRFAVNCSDQAGRYRMETLDVNFNPSKHPTEFQEHILSTVKELKGWRHAFYQGKDYDCYKFITIKIINGQIQKT
ncbi:hypothetical protein GCM10022393_37530 [Aquimarina addita]|uniref:Lipoprotein n=1 Tax=Aquimarina addita TaxID=870485 RepID=A0ABP6URR4_9FLAO